MKTIDTYMCLVIYTGQYVVSSTIIKYKQYLPLYTCTVVLKLFLSSFL